MSVWRLAGFIILAGIFALGNYTLNAGSRPVAEEALQEGEIRLPDVLSSRNPVLWIDARSEKEYASGRIPGALLLNEENWDHLLPSILGAWTPGQTIVVYCSSHSCQTSRRVADRLRAEVDLPGILILKGGWEAWLAGQN